MCVYVRAKFEVPGIILTKLDKGDGGIQRGGDTCAPQNEPFKSPPRLRLNFIFERTHKNLCREKLKQARQLQNFLNANASLICLIMQL